LRDASGVDELDLPRLWFEAFNRRDVEEMHRLAAEDFVFRPFLIGFATETIEGPDAEQQIVDAAESGWEGMRIQAEDTRRVGERLLVTGRLTAKGRSSGLDIDVSPGWVWELREGRLASLTAYADHAEALAALGLEDQA
jgi:ketosteroid isomerase-like protein